MIYQIKEMMRPEQVDIREDTEETVAEDNKIEEVSTEKEEKKDVEEIDHQGQKLKSLR